MKISLDLKSPPADSYRAARVQSLFNVDGEGGADFALRANLPLDEQPWSIGLVVGPSGSGKSSIGKAMWKGRHIRRSGGWPKGVALIDALAPEAAFDDVTAALSAVGLGSVPCWLRPYEVLSTGERFRADMARIILERPEKVILDEFTSVLDRRVAQIGAGAFAKAWRRGPGQFVALSCHYDIADWLQPDWIFDTATSAFRWRRLRRAPSIEVDVYETGWGEWPLFEPHHYLKLPRMVAATCYVGRVAREPVAHVAFSTRPGMKEARACRLVIMPEWQGAGVGMRFLNHICARWRRGMNRFDKPMPTLFHTSHPGLAAALRRDRNWTQVSGVLCGEPRARSIATLKKWAESVGKDQGTGGFGGHFRAVQGFRYLEAEE